MQQDLLNRFYLLSDADKFKSFEAMLDHLLITRITSALEQKLENVDFSTETKVSLVVYNRQFNIRFSRVAPHLLLTNPFIYVEILNFDKPFYLMCPQEQLFEQGINSIAEQITQFLKYIVHWKPSVK